MTHLFLTCALTLGLTLAACATPDMAAPETAVATSEVVSAPMTLDLEKGQVLQIAMVRERAGEEAQAVRDLYFRTAVPHAARLGDEYIGNLRIKETLLGKHRPRAVALWVFPDTAAQDSFRNSLEWPGYVQLRREGWEELHVYSAVVPDDMELTFDPDKDYTVAAAWTRPESREGYDAYLDGIERDFDQIGASYLARFDQVDLQSTVEDAENPSHITLVEWSDGPDLPGLRRTDAYRAYAERFGRAVSRFDLYWMNFPLPKR